jgi:hypothetical protein
MVQDKPNDVKKKKDRAAKKKRKISKHMIQAKKDHEELQKARDTEGIPDIEIDDPIGKAAASEPQKKKRSKANSHVKDVKEAAGYLTNWKEHQGHWKFNKNTQSWLIRHMYESEKVAKSTFTILLEYLEGLQGEGAKARISEDATRRALRYKKYSEESEEGGENQNNSNSEKKDSKLVQFTEDTKEPAAADGPNKRKKSKKEQQEANDEQTRWERLNDHDKRKEYKRARKVLEKLSETRK